MSQEIRLIARADDAGSAAAADRAIARTIDEGLVRNVSLMAVGPSIEHAAGLFAGRKGICFGVHATLNAEWDIVRWGPVLPVSEVPSLVEADTGYFTRSPRVFTERRPVIAEIMAELQAQLDRLRGLGFAIAYADMHMMFEWALPEIAEPFDRWCAREGLRNFKRHGKVLPSLTAEDERRLPDLPSRLVARLERADPGEYIVVGHPGYDDEEMRRMGADDYPSEKVVADRIEERLQFTRPDVIAYCRRSGVRSIRYDEAEFQ